MNKTNEQAFEALIEKALVGTTLEERQQTGVNDIDAQSPDLDKYYWGLPKDMSDKKYAFDMRRLWSFLRTTQQNIIDEYKGKNIENELPKQLSKAIDTFGIIEVLRKGVDIDNIHVTMFYPKPSPADSQLSKEKYIQNQFLRDPSADLFC